MSDGLNSFLFSTPDMTRVFSPQETLRAMMRFEWALTCGLEKNGLAEPGSAPVVEELLDAGFVDRDVLQIEARSAGNIVIPFTRQLTAAVSSRAPRAAGAIHFGATSQDVLDTALVLQMRQALGLLNNDIQHLDRALHKQVGAHRTTILTGRTWLQPGPPTTLGLKLAGTLAALRRSRDRIRSAAPRALTLQFGGAVGTLAVLGTAGGAVAAEMARILELGEAPLPWHSQRDSLVEIVQILAILTGSLAKFARDVALLMQPEVGEVDERPGDSKDASSTMPHKHNPVASAAVIAAHARMPGLATTMLCAMPQEHERGLGLWQAEWETIPEAFRLAASALAYSLEIAEGLVVHPARMLANQRALRGLDLSEAVSAALAPRIGRSAAHDLVRKAVARAKGEGRHLGEVLSQIPQVTAHLSPDAIDALMRPEKYLGSTERFIEEVLGEGNAEG